MSRGMWIIIVLITILMISSYWFSKNRKPPPWVKCKESLFEQVVLKNVLQVAFLHLLKMKMLNLYLKKTKTLNILIKV